MKRTFSVDDAKMLALAIDKAETWRGSLYPADYPAFDEEIGDMRRSLERAVETAAALRECKAANKRLQNQVEKLL